MKIVWGIDPGTTRVGIAIFAVDGRKARLLEILLIDLTGTDRGSRLSTIAETTSFLIDIYPPDEVGLEKLIWGRNVTTALEVAEIRGVLKYLFHQRGAQILECLPKVVKASVGASVFGKGKNAVKDAVIHIHSEEIGAGGVPWHAIIDDVIDAVAIGLAVMDGVCES